MNYLLDTHVLLWAAGDSARLPDEARRLILDEGSTVHFSAASIWEVTIKAALGRKDFAADPRKLRAGLIESGWNEIAISGLHAASMIDLPPIHKDPFDRMLIAQAHAEGMIFLTADAQIAQYPGNIRLI